MKGKAGLDDLVVDGVEPVTQVPVEASKKAD